MIKESSKFAPPPPKLIWFDKYIKQNRMFLFSSKQFYKKWFINTQVPRYLLFCEGGIYAHTSMGTKLSYILFRENVVNVTYGRVTTKGRNYVGTRNLHAYWAKSWKKILFHVIVADYWCSSMYICSHLLLFFFPWLPMTPFCFLCLFRHIKTDKSW